MLSTLDKQAYVLFAIKDAQSTTKFDVTVFDVTVFDVTVVTTTIGIGLACWTLAIDGIAVSLNIT